MSFNYRSRCFSLNLTIATIATSQSDPDGLVEEEDISTPLNPLPDNLNQLPVKMNLSFAGCGFMAVYHLGVAQALATHGRNFLKNVQCFAGASAGSLVAAMLAVKGDDLEALEECTKFCYDLAHNIRAHMLGVLTPGIDLLQPVEQFLTRMMPDDAHVLVSGRLFISVTNSNSKRNEIVSSFNSRHELIQYLLASSYIPVLTGSKPVVINGVKYYDGGMTDNLPLFAEGRTIRVSPFDGCQEICPRDFKSRRWYTSVHNMSFRMSVQNAMRGLHSMMPPTRRVLDNYHFRGNRDTVRFLRDEGLIDPPFSPAKPPFSPAKH